jgi:UDPglucose--hexose-1-phosphate uridylyltransferase
VELRKDPITRSWIVVGQGEDPPAPAEACPLCQAACSSDGTLLQLPAYGVPQVRVLPHFRPLYRIEGEASRMPDGMYDRMRAVGAHEIVIESPDHNQWLGRLRDDEIARVLEAYVLRIQDLKRDARFKYVTVFQNRGVLAGEEWSHPYSQVTAGMFVPRRILYELSSARAWFQKKERCVFCDIVRQEERQGVRIVDVQGDYLAFCPYASRVPFEVWLMRRRHNHLFEQPRPTSNRHHFAALLGRTLRRIAQVAPNYHMVLHTAPNTGADIGEIAPYWNTIADDFHWHFEILPIVEKRSKSYSIKEVYFNGLFPEQAAEQLRQLDSNA